MAEALLWLLRHCSCDHLIQFGGQVATPSSDRRHLCIEVLFHNGFAGCACKRWLSCEHSIQHSAQSVGIGIGIERLVLQLLGRTALTAAIVAYQRTAALHN